MALIVVQAQHAVVLAVEGLGKHGVGADGAGHMVAHLLQLLHRREHLPDLLVTEQTMLTAVGIQACNGHGALGDAQSAQGIGAADDVVDDALLGDHVAGLAQGYMPGQEEHPQIPDLKQGQRIMGIGQSAEDLGMADEVDATGLQGFLVDGGGGNRVHRPAVGQLNALFNILVGRSAAHAADLPHPELLHIHIVDINEVQNAGGVVAFLGLRDGIDFQPGHSGVVHGVFQNLPAADHDAAGSFLGSLIGQGFDDDFRADARRITHRNCDQRIHNTFLHFCIHIVS